MKGTCGIIKFRPVINWWSAWHRVDTQSKFEDQRVHYDSNEARLKALQMGANIISYAFSY